MINRLPVAMRWMFIAFSLCVSCFVDTCTLPAQQPALTKDSKPDHPIVSGRFRWRVSQPFLSVDNSRLPESPDHPWVAVKDPSVVRHEGKWHLFATLRKLKTGDGRIRIGHLMFDDWANAKHSKWHVLDLTPDYHGAPQIFYFEPHNKWYLIYQATDPSRGLKYGPCFSVNSDITKPNQWTLPEPLYVVQEGQKAGLDFWVICDDVDAHLFFTSLDGRMWRSTTALAKFPTGGWSLPQVVLKADIFEASHTYKIVGRPLYLTIVEAKAKRRRYFKGFVADSLTGNWRPLADTSQQPLVSPVNVTNQSESWATSYSHGEFVRQGFDQTMQIDPSRLQLMFQGANDAQYQTGDYGSIPWQLGLLDAE